MCIRDRYTSHSTVYTATFISVYIITICGLWGPSLRCPCLGLLSDVSSVPLTDIFSNAGIQYTDYSVPLRCWLVVSSVCRLFPFRYKGFISVMFKFLNPTVLVIYFSKWQPISNTYYFLNFKRQLASVFGKIVKYSGISRLRISIKRFSW